MRAAVTARGFFALNSMSSFSSAPSLGVYIHVPFCRSKCPYCDFYSLCGANEADGYTGAVINDIKNLGGMSEFVGAEAFSRPVDTVYFGGGTPSIIGAERITRLLAAVRESFTVLSAAEITVECNPSTPDIEDFFTACAKAGVNRVSLGMQSAVNSERRALGRSADAGRVKYCVQAARNAGIDNISLDIMLGVPGQTQKSLRDTLDFALSLKTPHLSAYILKLEEGTFFYKNKDRLSLPDEDAAADMYMLMCDTLEKAGMRHYEISNFCFGDKFSRHNLRYWQCGEYLGFGPSAHSFFNGRRFYYERDLKGYINGVKAVSDGAGGDCEEVFMLALRTDAGLDLNEWQRRFNMEINGKFRAEAGLLSRYGLINEKNGVISLTDKGMLLSNSVISSLLSKL